MGVPSLLQGGHSIPAMAAGVLHALDHHQRKESERKQRAPPARGCRPEPSTPACPRQAPVGLLPGAVLLLHPLLGPAAHLLAFRTAALLNGSLCAPQELAPKSPDRNAGQRCLLWIQAQLGAVPICGRQAFLVPPCCSISGSEPGPR